MIERLDHHIHEQVNDLKHSIDMSLKKHEERTRELKDELMTKVGRMDAQILELKSKTGQLDDAYQFCESQVHDLESWIGNVSNDIDNRVDLEVEDRVLGIKVDMEDFVKDELKNTEEAVIERINEASLYIEFRQ